MTTNYIFKITCILLLITGCLFPKIFWGQDRNPIHTAVPIMMVTPDARSSGMGDISVATTPDGNSHNGNAAKTPFLEDDMGISLSYVPWLQGLVSDVSIAYMSLYYKFDNVQSISGAIRYFSLGEMALADDMGYIFSNVKPMEFSIETAYSRMFGKYMSGSLTLKYIRSDLTGGYANNSSTSGLMPANAVGADIGLYYQREPQYSTNQYAFGFAIRNIGSKISYTENSERYFMPTTLHLGGRYTLNFNTHNNISLGGEFSKLLVPTPPEVASDGTIIKGRDSNVGAVEGMFQSFYDAPGGFKEELSEIMMGFGLEYAYRKLFAVRTGYFHDAEKKGNRSYLTFGAGVRYTFLGLDLSYIYPFTKQDPLANTIRITLSLNLNKKVNR
ncbi:MAG: type IX secretion system outer membrane channel protein PorV [Bacteroidales bacterium]